MKKSIILILVLIAFLLGLMAGQYRQMQNIQERYIQVHGYASDAECEDYAYIFNNDTTGINLNPY